MERAIAKDFAEAASFCEMLEEFSHDSTVALIIKCVTATSLSTPNRLASLIHSHGILQAISRVNFEQLTPWGRQCIRERFYTGSFNLADYMDKNDAEIQDCLTSIPRTCHADKSIPELAASLSYELAEMAFPGCKIERLCVAQDIYRQLKLRFKDLT
jgi:hypothetical protein